MTVEVGRYQKDASSGKLWRHCATCRRWIWNSGKLWSCCEAVRSHRSIYSWGGISFILTLRNQNYEKVLRILNQQLSSVLSTVGAERDLIVRHGDVYSSHRIEGWYCCVSVATLSWRANGHFRKASSQFGIWSQRVIQIHIGQVQTFDRMLLLITFFDLYHTGRYPEALQVLLFDPCYGHSNL